ncbi:hypothetical protein G9A89_020066 [Geosiphon pyriformis]|nr:hypothetical protein G9A89_020066 [Geosiphon pyriformis]
MKFFETSYTFRYPWSYVSAANWRKYPNEECPHVVAVDVLDRYVDPVTGILRTERLITCQQNIPKWILKLCGEETVSYAREISEIDPKNKTLRMTSSNLTMNHLVNVSETVTYKEDPNDPCKTLFQQEARIKCGESISRFTNYLEDFCVARFRENSVQGRQGFENVLERLRRQGETT